MGFLLLLGKCPIDSFASFMFFLPKAVTWEHGIFVWKIQLIRFATKELFVR